MPIEIVNNVTWGRDETPAGVEEALSSALAYDATVLTESSSTGVGNARSADVSAFAYNAFVTISTSSELSHGEQIPATSDLAATVIGPTGTLTPTSPRTFTNGQVIENEEIRYGQSVIAAGARVIFRNCRFITSWTNQSGSYALKIGNAQGAYVTIEDCEIVTRNNVSKGIAGWGNINLEIKRTIFRGGMDNLYVGGVSAGAGIITTGDALVPNARVLLEECWFGDIERSAGSHSDCVQVDPASYVVMRRCRVMSYSIPQGSDPLETRVTDPSTATLASGGYICTQNDNNVQPATHYAIRDCWLEGGNYTLDVRGQTTGQTAVNVQVTDNKFGIRHNFGPILGSATRSGNTWGQSGTTGGGLNVVAGQPVPGG